MFLKPYRIERRVPIGTTAKDVFSFSVNNFNPDGFKFIISYTQVSSFEGISRSTGIIYYTTSSRSGGLRMLCETIQSNIHFETCIKVFSVSLESDGKYVSGL